MVQVLTLEKNPRAAAVSGQALRVINRRGPADVIRQVPVQPGHELLVLAPAMPGFAKFLQGVHERLGDVGTSVLSEVPGFVGLLRKGLSWCLRGLLSH